MEVVRWTQPTDQSSRTRAMAAQRICFEQRLWSAGDPLTYDLSGEAYHVNFLKLDKKARARLASSMRPDAHARAVREARRVLKVNEKLVELKRQIRLGKLKVMSIPEMGYKGLFLKEVVLELGLRAASANKRRVRFFGACGVISSKSV